MSAVAVLRHRMVARCRPRPEDSPSWGRRISSLDSTAIGLASIVLVVVRSPSPASASATSHCSISATNRTEWREVQIDVAIVGIPKCGTTYLRNLLAMHPELACPSIALGEHPRCLEELKGAPLRRASPPVDFVRRMCATARGPGIGTARRVVIGDPRLLFWAPPAGSIAQIPSIRAITCIREPIAWLVSARNHVLREMHARRLARWGWRTLSACPANHTPSMPPSLADIALGCKWNWVHRMNYDKLPRQLSELAHLMLGAHVGPQEAFQRMIVVSLEASEHDQVGTWLRLTRWLGLTDVRSLAEQPDPFGKAKDLTKGPWFQSWCTHVSPDVRAAVHGHFERAYSALLGFALKSLPHSILSPSQVAGTARVLTC